MRFLLITRSYADSRRVKNLIDWEGMGHKLLIELNPLSAPDKIRLIRPDAIILFGSLGGADLSFLVNSIQNIKLSISIIVLPNNQQWREEEHPSKLTITSSIIVYYVQKFDERQLLSVIESLAPKNNKISGLKSRYISNVAFPHDAGCLMLCSVDEQGKPIREVCPFISEEVNNQNMEIVEESPLYTVIISTYDNAVRVKDFVWEKDYLQFYCTNQIGSEQYSIAYKRLLMLNKLQYFINRRKLFGIDINTAANTVAFPNDYVKGFQDFYFQALNGEREKAIKSLAFFLTHLVQPTMNFGVVEITRVLLAKFFVVLNGDNAIAQSFFKYGPKIENDIIYICDKFDSILTGIKHRTLSSDVRNATHYIDTHYSQDLRVEDISDSLQMSLSSLSKKFKKQTGISLVKYISVFRVTLAALEIAQTNETINSIAERNGFADAKYFSRVFKTITDKAPSDYRENIV